MNIQKAIAGAATATRIKTNTDIVLQSPIYTEYDKTINQKAVVINGIIHAAEVTFSGHGTVKDVNFTDSGKGLVIPRGNSGVINIKGQVAIMPNTGDKTSFNFQEIGHSDATGTVRATGAAFFDANATGRLAFLSNMVVIYKDQIDKYGNDKVIA